MSTKEITPSILNTLYTALYEEYGEEREGTHVSDLIYCPRKSCYNKIDPRPLNNKQLNFFTSGKAIHGALQSLIKKYPDRFEIEMEVKNGDLVAHIDIYDKELKMPIEAKSARLAKMDQVKKHYIAQLEAYMALTDSDKGMILVQCLMHFEDRPFVEFYHTMTKEQRIATLDYLKNLGTLVQNGIILKKPELVPHIAYNEDYNWLCKSCPYAIECEKLRAKEPNRQVFSK